MEQISAQLCKPCISNIILSIWGREKRNLLWGSNSVSPYPFLSL